jgi:hypothetical protein
VRTCQTCMKDGSFGFDGAWCVVRCRHDHD